MHVKKFTDDHRKELLQLGRDSFFFFAKGLLGFEDMSDHIHFDLCQNLQGKGPWGKWNRGVVVMSRGYLKSTITTIGYPIWCAFYPEELGLKDHATRILGASYENARDNFVAPGIDLFRNSRRADFLNWLYGGKKVPGVLEHPITPGFADWNESTIAVVKWDAYAQNAVTCKGMMADQEGWHGNLGLCDDLEGADAEKVISANADARKAVVNVVPLLIEPQRDRILLVGTPHGRDPVTFRALREDFSSDQPERSNPIEWDNDKRYWKYFYVPLVDTSGNPTWPERFDKETCKAILSPLNTDERTRNQQYLLRETESGESLFRIDLIERSFFRWGPDKAHIDYPVRLGDTKKWFKDGVWEESVKWRRVKARELRTFLHCDLVHREDTVSHKSGGKRPSKAAMVVVGVAPDGHFFVLEEWTDENVSIEEQARVAYRLYAQYGCHQASWDSVGAQVWFKSYVELLERTNPAFAHPRSSGKWGGESRLMPRLSYRLVEDNRTTRMHKEDVIYERLSGPLEDGRLHLHPDHIVLLEQLRGAFDGTKYIDVADCLAQGPPIWSVPASEGTYATYRRQDQLQKQMRSRYTGYWSPWRGQKIPKVHGHLEDAPPGATTINIKDVRRVP